MDKLIGKEIQGNFLNTQKGTKKIIQEENIDFFFQFVWSVLFDILFHWSAMNEIVFTTVESTKQQENYIIIFLLYLFI